MTERTREPQYQRCVELRDANGLGSLGLMTSQSWHDDPKHLLFNLARYKFVAKMLAGKARVLEVGCADAFGTRLVAAEVGGLTAVDFDPVFVEDARRRADPAWPVDLRVHDILERPVAGRFDAVYALDVLEHVRPADEARFLDNATAPLDAEGVLILGTPSLQSQVHASAASREGHVNCKDGPALKALLAERFHNVFVFSMNDEVVHTGFYPMAHYLLALACSKR
jgi:2-polyprenyl-3-methyl-5-hydroxy-6-metoxy-1,4-benzoquinol methylase